MCVVTTSTMMRSSDVCPHISFGQYVPLSWTRKEKRRSSWMKKSEKSLIPVHCALFSLWSPMVLDVRKPPPPLTPTPDTVQILQTPTGWDEHGHLGKGRYGRKSLEQVGIVNIFWPTPTWIWKPRWSVKIGKRRDSWDRSENFNCVNYGIGMSRFWFEKVDLDGEYRDMSGYLIFYSSRDISWEQWTAVTFQGVPGSSDVSRYPWNEHGNLENRMTWDIE